MTSARSAQPAIVVGVDGSHPAQLALRWAITEAGVRGCPVHVVHAWSIGTARDFVWTSRRDLRADSHALLDTAITTAREHVGAPVPVVRLSMEGRPGPVLVEAARGASLLVLGAHEAHWGSSGLGSIGFYCVRHASVPVAVVPQTEPAVQPVH